MSGPHPPDHREPWPVRSRKWLAVGHGVEAGGHFFCCASYARMSGHEGAADHVR